MLLARKLSAFHLRTLRESKNSQGQGAVVRGQREKIQNGQTGDKRFENEGGVRVQH